MRDPGRTRPSDVAAYRSQKTMTDEPPFEPLVLNESIIRDSVASGNVDRLISLFQFLKDGRDRAEFQVKCLEHQIALLEKATKAITEPLRPATRSNEKDVFITPNRPTGPKTKPVTEDPLSAAIDIDL